MWALSVMRSLVWESNKASRPRDLTPGGGREAPESLHVHFGAGRLGFGLVLPCLEKSHPEPFVMLNRPSASWAPLVQRRSASPDGPAQATVTVKINGEVCATLLVVTEADVTDADGGVLECVRRGQADGWRGFLVLSTDADAVRSLLCAATSFSCAVGSKALVDLLAPLLALLPEKEDEDRPVLYACENDHSTVEVLQFRLRRKVEAVPCMVDRICASVDVSPDGSEVSVSAEDHEGSVVLLQGSGETGPPSPRDALSKAGDIVKVPSKEAHARYLYRKKMLTVNAMHTVLAFVTLTDALATQGADFAIPESCPDVPLVRRETLTAEQHSDIWCWAVAQLLVLVWEHGASTMMAVEKSASEEELVTDLLHHARETLDRFFSIEDSTARVLGGGVSLRYEGRLLPVYQTIAMDAFAESWSSGCIQYLLLEHAGLELEKMRETLGRLVEDARPFAAVDKRVQAEKALKRALEEELAAQALAAATARTAAAGSIAVLFDFDGTLGDTEAPAMEVAFWELAPYFPSVTAELLTPQSMRAFVRENAGKPFELMVESVESGRAAAGLPPIEAVRESRGESLEVVSLVNRQRTALGLPTLEATRSRGLSLLQLQKEETVESLAVMARPCEGVFKTMNHLRAGGFRYAISTTSPKPRVPVCVDRSGLREWFDEDAIHSGESDFDPPRFKPEPHVYLRAAAQQETPVTSCIAVEDSASGVGSAANAGVGLIIGYVGASHIAPESKDRHAVTLLSGDRSESGRGADIVVSEFVDIIHIVERVLEIFLLDESEERRPPLRPFVVDEVLHKSFSGKYWYIHRGQGGLWAPDDDDLRNAAQ